MEHKIIDYDGLSKEELAAELDRLGNEEGWEPVFPFPGKTWILLRRNEENTFYIQYHNARAAIQPIPVNLDWLVG